MKYLLLLSLALCLLSCEEKEPKENFNSWYEERFDKASYYRDHTVELPQADSFVIVSHAFTIDTIYRSMKGPFQDIIFSIDAQDSLLWLTGYKVETLDANNDSMLAANFMCHNNLNLSEELLMPWRNELNYFNLRLFTLTQGGEQILLPKGFGIPVYGTQTFETNAQVLNHNIYPINRKVKQRITIYYHPERKLKRRMIPLEQRTIFAFKQYGGPEGLYGETPTNDNYILRQQFEVTQPKCGVGELANGTKEQRFDLFHDPFGRLFTGHWKIAPDSKEDFTIDISSLLKLQKPTKVHFINAHVHPFCEQLSLIDNTTKKLVFSSKISNRTDGIGLDSIGNFSEQKGIAIYPDHNYAIRSIYHNKSADTLSAMSVMYLYLQN